jgi:hypothetical protein
MKGLGLLVIIAGVGIWLFKMTGGTRARVEIRVTDGRTWVTRGRIPGKFLREIQEICRDVPNVNGVVRIQGTSLEPEVIIEGLPKHLRQPILNVLANAGL